MIASVQRNRTWVARAACAGDPHPDDWFSGNLERRARAMAICESCPAWSACLDASLEAQEPHGIWAGFHPVERGAAPPISPARRADPVPVRVPA